MSVPNYTHLPSSWREDAPYGVIARPRKGRGDLAFVHVKGIPQWPGKSLTNAGIASQPFSIDYDIDGIEFDFRRWFFMISELLKNHTILTRLVRDSRKMLDLCTTALKMYEDGADGISMFNWYSHLRDAKVLYLWTDGENAAGAAADAVQTYIYPLLKDPDKIRWYLAQPWALPSK